MSATYRPHDVTRFYEAKEKYKQKISYLALARGILEEVPIITVEDNSTMLFYNAQQGIYKRGAENKIKEISKRYTEEEITSRQIQETILQIQTLTYTPREKLNEDKNLLVLANCVYNLDTGETQEHSPEIISTVRIPVEFKADADCPLIKKFLSEVVDKKSTTTIQQLFGYCLYRDYPIQRAVMLVGEGANGKSTLLSLLKTFLGKENVSAMELQDLDKTKDRFAIAGLYGKLANLGADLSERAVNYTGDFKKLTGDDTLTAQQKFKSSFEFVNTAKLIFSTNRLPAVKDKSDAFFRRWVFLFFNNTFQGKDADKNLLKKLTAPEELSGLFNWAIAGLKDLLTVEEFKSAVETDTLREMYNALSNSLGAFVAACVTVDAGNTISKDEFYSAYAEYCLNNNYPPFTKAKIGRELQQHIECGEGKKGQARAWTGIKIKETKQGGLNEFC